MLACFRRSGSATAIFSIIILLSLTLHADAKKKKRPKKTKPSRIFVLDTSLDIKYHDNIINYSDDDLDLYDVGEQESKFSIKSKDDWILVPRIEPSIKGRFLGRHQAWLKFNYRYYFYSQNDIRRYQRFGLSGRHYIAKSVYAEIEYAYIPEYYYRNQYVTDDTGNSSYIEANFSKHYLKFEYGMNLIPTLKADLSYRYQKKTFNPELSERDLSVNGIRLDGIWKMSKKYKFWSYYGFERAEAHGADIADLDVNDVSYDAWDITFGGRYYSRLFGKYKPEFVSTFKFRQIRYQTIKYVDAYRFGRQDNNYYFRVGTAWNFPRKIRIEADYNLIAKRVGSLFDPTKISVLEYSSNSVSIKIKRRF